MKEVTIVHAINVQEEGDQAPTCNLQLTGSTTEKAYSDRDAKNDPKGNKSMLTDH